MPIPDNRDSDRESNGNLNSHSITASTQSVLNTVGTSKQQSQKRSAQLVDGEDDGSSPLIQNMNAGWGVDPALEAGGAGTGLTVSKSTQPSPPPHRPSHLTASAAAPLSSGASALPCVALSSASAT
ncbi:hypothetical protein BV25DRAFT_1922068 [Artomyces pyxidatus]|uniref:Uncharacterized protein n=1 Tax=Artomyces pyxidatus TaxID=48021 RepID=A0ACB8SF97_9AGAM|nr:hypothetical protein BV25DRAFT_1922068 [Artomyces pyxidatus]